MLARLRAGGLTWPLVWMGLLTLVLLWTRLVGLDQSLQQDEAFTVRQYVVGGPDSFLAGDYNPNNHLLFSWLAWLTTSVVGQSEPLDRIWGVLPGTAAVAILGWWVWRRLGPWTAVITVFFIVTAPLHLDFIKQARGYGLASLAFVLMFIASERVLSDPSRRSFAAWGVAGFLGVATHLMFTFAFLGSAVALAVVVSSRRTVAVVVGVVGVAALAFYFPLLEGMLKTFGEYGTASLPDPSLTASIGAFPGLGAVGIPQIPWHGPVTGGAILAARGVELLVTGDARETCQGNCFEGAQFVRYALPALGLMVIGAVALWRDHGWRLLVLILMPMLVTFTPLAILGALVVDRFLLHLLPLVAILMAVAVVAIVSTLWRTRWLRPAVVVVGTVLALSGMMRILDLNSRWSALPFENAKLVGEIVDSGGIEPVVTNSNQSEGLFFYLGANRLRPLAVPELEALFCDRAATFTYVDYPLRTLRPDTECLFERGASKFRVTQRGRGGFMEVWVVQPPP